METETLLGPFFRLTALKDDEEIANTLFSNPRKRTRQDVDQSMTSLRASLKVLRHGLHEIMLSLLKASPESREAVLEWFATFLHFDKERVKLQADYKKLATDGFAMNVMSVLLLLSQPFSDPHSPKLDNIDPTFCVSKHRIDYSGETRLAVDSQDLARWVDPKNPNAQVSFQNMKRQQAMELANSGARYLIEEIASFLCILTPLLVRFQTKRRTLFKSRNIITLSPNVFSFLYVHVSWYFVELFKCIKNIF